MDKIEKNFLRISSLFLCLPGLSENIYDFSTTIVLLSIVLLSPLPRCFIEK